MASVDGLMLLVRYGIVGLVTNGLLFLGYLALSNVGIGPKVAMSVLYVPGVLLGFVGNRNFTFRHRGRIPASIIKYVATYAFGYVFNFVCLVVFVDVLGVSPDWAVLALIFVTAALLLALQRWWVFAERPHARVGAPT